MSIRYTTRGSGEDLVIFLHEWLGDSQNWEAIFPYLPTTGYRHVFADLRGYGLSKDISGSYTLDEAAADVFALTRQFNSNHFAIVAHSMSGLIAQHISHTHRDSVRGMMLISPVPASGFRMDAAGFARLIAVTTDDNAAREAISARTGGRYGPTWLERKLSMARAAASADAMKSYAQMFTQSDITAQVKGLSTPITILTGYHDIPIYKKESALNLFGALYSKVTIDECLEAGHYSMLEAPIFTAAKIEIFLEKLPSNTNALNRGASGAAV